jgi:hypothetical protein
LALLALAVGCGEGVEPVQGRVTLDGRPLPGTTVAFLPDDPHGRPSFARTDAEGHYVLHAEQELAGAPPGRYRVRISTYVEGNPDADPPLPAIPERVPARYNVNTQLEADVATGQNVFDFHLRSGGEVHQPGH